MGSLTIRKLDDDLKTQLRVRAARNGRSMEEEARVILARELRVTRSSPNNLADAIAAIVDPIGGIEFEPLPRGLMRELPHFDDESKESA